jgi:hypothetical protein
MTGHAYEQDTLHHTIGYACAVDLRQATLALRLSVVCPQVPVCPCQLLLKSEVRAHQ